MDARSITGGCQSGKLEQGRVTKKCKGNRAVRSLETVFFLRPVTTPTFLIWRRGSAARASAGRIRTIANSAAVVPGRVSTTYKDASIGWAPATFTRAALDFIDCIIDEVHRSDVRTNTASWRPLQTTNCRSRENFSFGILRPISSSAMAAYLSSGPPNPQVALRLSPVEALPPSAA